MECGWEKAEKNKMTTAWNGHLYGLEIHLPIVKRMFEIVIQIIVFEKHFNYIFVCICVYI